MKDKISPRSGILDCEQGNATFYEENYNFRIMNNIPFQNSPDANISAKIKIPDKYFYGITHDGKLIAIYLGDSSIPSIKTFSNFHTNLYAVQDNATCVPEWNQIDAIKFRGGTLNQLFCSHQTPYEIIGDTIRENPPKPAYPFTIKYNNLDITISIGEAVHKTSSPTDISISGKNGYFDLQFSSPISFSEVSFHIDKVKTLLSFLTFRSNVDFDEIILQKKLPPYGTLWDSAHVYSEELSSPTQKEEINNICFEELGQNISFLIDLIYNESKNNPFTFMNFIPESDKNIDHMTNNMVKNIVTCMECEIARLRKDDVTLVKSDNKSDTYLAEEKLLASLKKELLSTIKAYEKTQHRFSKKTNDMLCGGIKHMTLADADKIHLIYPKYQNLLCNLFDEFETPPTIEDIEQLMIYRNKTTHGMQEVLNSHIAITARYLVGLIYCMILHSIGIDDNDLQNLCKKHFLY